MPALALQMIFEETNPTKQDSHLQGRTFYNSLLYNLFKTWQFRNISRYLTYKIQFNLTIYSRLPGLSVYHQTIKFCTFYNTDGLINWLRQPGQIRNGREGQWEKYLIHLLSLVVPGLILLPRQSQ